MKELPQVDYSHAIIQKPKLSSFPMNKNKYEKIPKLPLKEEK
jgi:hypothetical protein